MVAMGARKILKLLRDFSASCFGQDVLQESWTNVKFPDQFGMVFPIEGRHNGCIPSAPDGLVPLLKVAPARPKPQHSF